MAVVLPIGLVAVVGSGVAAARGKRPSPPPAATGSTTCEFQGTLATRTPVSPTTTAAATTTTVAPTTTAAATTTTVAPTTATTADPATMSLTMAGALIGNHRSACSSRGRERLGTGHLSGLTGTAPSGGLCSLLSGGSLPDLSGGSIRWSEGRNATSTGVALTGGSVSVVANGKHSVLQIVYTGGSVIGGSYTNASGASLTATSRKRTTQLADECANGHLHEIEIDGSLTL